MEAQPVRVFLVAGEASGDQLGASLIRALRAVDPTIEFAAVGGARMAEEGVPSLFPLSDIAVMGLGPVIRRLPTILRRMGETVRAVQAFRPDVLVTIDSPDFSKRVAKRVRAANPAQATMHWVCPSVWAWRPGRAPAMKPSIDHVLCLLPFEPEALRRLKGPAGTYIGHPAVERLAEFRPQTAEEAASRADLVKPTVLVLPGSRMSEIRRLLPDFLATLGPATPADMKPDWVIPTLPHLAAEVRARVSAAGLPVRVVVGEAEKLAAFRRARAALAASGTVTLELALAQIPMVAAYRVAEWEAFIARRLITASSAILPNLVLGERLVPEFIQEEMGPLSLAPRLHELLQESPARRRQLEGFARLEAIMKPADARPPSALAAGILLELARKRPLPPA
ncbi:MAG: lipid-A-disaccharide synthase [Methylobacterium sp.]|nr:lipid-A-disaccharide synthase [Methylobacterium sp.]MCA3597100.1 lipid-A-disaccharide synthase [Methylobacterium sp.]MCA3600652.1 lipid-A-disaccharide synthase [Methylobacterium sp.]MCA3604433.1 lipid-A-disaccharide synthase [Methylobacterium sp.]MCA3607823.1 lipid-A-disaccharide synthase [Methylobacterium sp.]